VRTDSELKWLYTGLRNKSVCHSLRHTATHCNTLQHTASLRHSLQQTATHCLTATHCNTLQHTATHCLTATHCNTLQHTATHCNTLQHTASLRHSLRQPRCNYLFLLLLFILRFNKKNAVLQEILSSFCELQYGPKKSKENKLVSVNSELEGALTFLQYTLSNWFDWDRTILSHVFLV